MLSFATCPRCNVDLPSGAASCSCGWIARREPEPPPDPQKYEKERKDNLAEANREALEWCIAQGLDSREKQRAYIRDKLPKIHRNLRIGEGEE
jgi:hypothetical protein